VITGFNTDVEYDGVTYHVQTEDKGLRTPFILSLVYNRGTILASRRVPYDDLVKDGLNERALTERLQKQHKTICAAVKKGRIDEFKRKPPPSAPTIPEHAADEQILSLSDEPVSLKIPAAKRSTSGAKPSNGQGKVETTISAPSIPMPPVSHEVDLKPQPTESELHNTDVTVFEETPLLPMEAVKIVSDLAGMERPSNNNLSVELIGDSEFRGGDSKLAVVMVCRGSERKVVADSEVMIKILGSSFKPLIFHSRTDKNGLSRVNIQLPRFSSGRATVVVRAMSMGEEVEIRRAIAHG
jgi:hypothetical protein